MKIINALGAVAKTDLLSGDSVVIENGECYVPTFAEMEGKTLGCLYSVLHSVKQGDQAVLIGPDTVLQIDET